MIIEGSPVNEGDVNEVMHEAEGQAQVDASDPAVSTKKMDEV